MKYRSVVIDSLPQAYELIKEMNLDTDQGDWEPELVESSAKPA